MESPLRKELKRSSYRLRSSETDSQARYWSDLLKLSQKAVIIEYCDNPVICFRIIVTLPGSGSWQQKGKAHNG